MLRVSLAAWAVSWGRMSLEKNSSRGCVVDRPLRLSCAFLTALALAACGKPQQQQMGPPEVGVVVLHPESVTLTAELAGRTAPFVISEVRPQVNGIIKSRRVKEGANVNAGDVLYEID